jgi:Mrp family chromosome partitioning ATPase
MVKEIRQRIAETEELKKKLEEENPGLANLGIAAPAQNSQQNRASLDIASELTRAAALGSRIKVLNSQLDQVRSEASSVDQIEPAILELQRKKELEESHYKNLATTLEQSRISEALGAGKVSNISKIQSPSPPYRESAKRLKTALGIILGSFFSGIGLAFIIELFIDNSVKRPKDIEVKLGLPLFLSIPDLTRDGARRDLEEAASSRLWLQGPKGELASGNARSAEAQKSEMVLWDSQHFLRPFYEALRDRLITNLENRNITRKPKLVAVTGLARGAGVTTIASGLAACLSETGDGNVLLVDMNAEQAAAQQFYKGKPGCGLEAALEPESKDHAQVQENLYVVAEGLNRGKLPCVAPRRFSSLVPRLKASDYDYIIFDMPPVTQTSVTPRLSSHMDLVLMVMESEKSRLHLAKRANALLRDAKTYVAAVLNKHQSHVPERLSQE